MVNNNDNILIEINRKRFLKYSPNSVLFFSIVFTSLMFIIAPITIKNTLTIDAVLYVIMCLIFFWGGTLLIKEKKKEPLIISVPKLKLNKLYKITFIIGSVGVCLKYFDLFIFRSLSFESSLVDNQDFAAESGGSVYSVIASLIIYFSFIPLTINIIAPTLKSYINKVLSFILFLLVPISTLLFGSRFGIIIPFSYLILLLLFTGAIKIKFRVKTILFIFIVSVIFSSIISTLFLKRLEEMGITGNASVSGITGGYADKVPASLSYQKLMYKCDGTLIYPYLFAFANITQYTTHATLEFPIVKGYVDNNDISPTYGKSTFFVYYKFIEIFTDPKQKNIDNLAKSNIRNGIWSTFFFYWYLDFKWVGILLMSILGYIFKKVWARVYYHGDISFIPLSIYIPIIVFLMPQLNYLAGTSCYVITAFTIVPILFKLKK